MNKLFIAALTVAMMSSSAISQDINQPDDTYVPPKKEYSPFVDDHFPNQVFFGDTHVHTSWSTDAGMIGVTVGPVEAYRFAQGEAVASSLGWNVKLIRPLDFILISDHAENLGLADYIKRSDPILLANPQ